MQRNNIFELFNDPIFTRGVILAKNNLAEYSIYAIIAFLGLSVFGYILLKLFIPEVIITSWWRTQEQVKKLTGMNFDWHMLGLAYDITLPGNKITPEVFEKVKKIFPVVIVERGNKITSLKDADHMHVAWINKRLGVQIG